VWVSGGRKVRRLPWVVLLVVGGYAQRHAQKGLWPELRLKGKDEGKEKCFFFIQSKTVRVLWSVIKPVASF